MNYIRCIINNIRYNAAVLRRDFITLVGVGGSELYMLFHSETESEICLLEECFGRILNIITTPIKWEEINDALAAIDNVIIYYMLKCYDK